MRWLNDLPIRWKLVLVTILTCAIAELLAGAVLTGYSSWSYRSQKSQDVGVQAEVLAASLSAPLVFGDAAATQEYLNALKANREIAAAGAYDAKGALLARYTAQGSPPGLLPNKAQPTGQHFDGALLMVSQPVEAAGNKAGSVYLVVNTEPLGVRLARVGGLLLLAVIGSLLIAVPISMQLNSTISNAIRDIAGAASRVTGGDLNVELPSSRRTDEIGVLVSTFGKMLASLREMMRQERLRALGQMSSGVAHDINNTISPVALHTQSLLEREKNLPPHIRNYLETVKRVVDDVTATVGRMREFSRKREPEMTLAPLDLNKLVQQVIDLTHARWSDMQHQQGSVIELQTDLAPALPVVMGVEGEIREALTNLIFNAVDAMPEGGTLTLRTNAGSGTPQHVWIEVADTGIGMDDETRRRCFEPFYTTKGERGTGLGMAMVYGVVQRHSAEIEIESAVGKGTMVRLIFLARAAVAAELSERKPAAAASPELRILIVDDDPFILDSMRAVLELDGHTIVLANGGQEGIDCFRKAQASGEKFAAVITDLGMPYVDGNQVARAIKGMSPSTQVILLTGWGRRMNADGDAPPNVDHLLGKPPQLDELRAVLANCA